MKINHFLFIVVAATFVSCGDKGIDDPPRPVENLLEKITDPLFLAYCQNRMTQEETYAGWPSPAWDSNKDGLLSNAEAEAVTRIILPGTLETNGGFKSLDDIGYFTGLTELQCNYNQLTSIDVSKLTELDYFSCYDNQLTALDLTKNTKLTHLYCERNKLTALDLSKNTMLEYLYCGANPLTTLDVSKNTVLERLDFGTSDITEIDLSKNKVLKDLTFCFTQISSIDISKNTELTDLFCIFNRLTSLDVSKNTKLKDCLFYGNPGDGVSKLPVTAWFDNDNIPNGFTRESWKIMYNTPTITADYRKAQ